MRRKLMNNCAEFQDRFDQIQYFYYKNILSPIEAKTKIDELNREAHLAKIPLAAQLNHYHSDDLDDIFDYEEFNYSVI